MNSSQIKKVVLTTLAIAVLVTNDGCLGNNGPNPNNPLINGVQGPTVSFVNNQFTMSAVLTHVVFDSGVTFPIPFTKQSYVEVLPNTAGGTLIQIGIGINDIAYLQSNIQLLPPNTLPGGRPLPGIAGGTLPSTAVDVPGWNNTVFYLGANVLGVFVPVNLGFQLLEGTFAFYDSNNKQIGTISIIGSDSSGKNSGFLLFVDFQSEDIRAVTGL